MTRQKNPPRLHVGDVFGVETPGGWILGHYVLEVDDTPGWGGSLVRVKARLVPSVPDDQDGFFEGPGADLVTFMLLRGALRDGVATSIVGHLPVAERWQSLPLFRVGDSDQVWGGIEGGEPNLTPGEVAKLPPLESVTEGALLFEVYERLKWPVAEAELEIWYDAAWEAKHGSSDTDVKPEDRGDEPTLVITVDPIEDDLQRFTLVDKLRTKVADLGGEYDGSEISLSDATLRFFVHGDPKTLEPELRVLLENLVPSGYTIAHSAAAD